jgi:hypothetical protein
MMIEANVPLNLRFRLFKEAFHTVTDLDASVPIELDGKIASRYSHWSGGKEPIYAKFLRTWGEAGTEKATGKLKERGTASMGIGGGFDNTKELHVLDFNQAMASTDKDKWIEAVDEEYEQIQKHRVFKPVRIDSLPPNIHTIDST